MPPLKFKIEKKLKGKLGRAGVLKTPHGDIETPAFVVVGTKATVKSLTPEQVKSLGTQVVLANTYHLYLEPGDELIKKAGGLRKFMNWQGPTMTDSGGFQVFSLGEAYGKGISKVTKKNEAVKALDNNDANIVKNEAMIKLAKIDEDGITFKSVIDGSSHRFTPEESIKIQRNIGADMIFSFDECTSPLASYEYQKEAMDRTHRWAKRCLDKHCELKMGDENQQTLFGIVQGGRFEDLRKLSAKTIGEMGFDGFGIGGSFDKEDMCTAVNWVNEILTEEKPRHLLGIGHPRDLFMAVESGCDLFDCVAPTRIARNGSLYTKSGTVNILNAKFVSDFSKIDENCGCYTCENYTKAYLSHLFRAKEILANTLASVHNLYFTVNLVKNMRQSILDDNFFELKEAFLRQYE